MSGLSGISPFSGVGCVRGCIFSLDAVFISVSFVVDVVHRAVFWCWGHFSFPVCFRVGGFCVSFFLGFFNMGRGVVQRPLSAVLLCVLFRET